MAVRKRALKGRGRQLPFSRSAKLIVLVAIVSLTASASLLASRSTEVDSQQRALSESPQAPGEQSRDPQVVEFSDIDFAKKKLLYHQLAAVLADKAKADATRPEVRRIAEQMSRDETARANLYADLLNSWEEPYFNITEFPETKGCHGYPTFTGMLPYVDVGTYRLSSGVIVDEKFLSLVIAHHSGADDLDRIEGGNVGNGDLIKLRDDSSRDYGAEINTLKSLQLSFSS